MNNLEPSVVMFDNSRTGFDPIAAIEIVNAIDHTIGGMMDMAADDAVAHDVSASDATASSKAPIKLTARLTLYFRYADKRPIP